MSKSVKQAMYSSSIKGDGPPNPTLDQGYTYLGQFLSHELVPATNPDLAIRSAGREFSGRIDLESVYGPTESPDKDHVNKDHVDKKGQFFLTNRLGVLDIPRNGDEAAIPESRNDENALVSQLHLLLLRTHNLLLENETASNYSEARELVTLLVQLITIEDYLRQLLTPELFQHYFRNNGEDLLRLTYEPIPVEFSSAVFRFGHSMVRTRYQLRTHPSSIKNLSELFRRGKLLEKEFEVDWPIFFGLQNSHTQRISSAKGSNLIDLQIQKVMRKVPLADGSSADLISDNLKAGKKVEPEFGVDYINKSVPESTKERFTFNTICDKDLPKSFKGIRIEHLPLWCYVLLEATKVPHRELPVDEFRGILGTLGGMIIGETFRHALRKSKTSLFVGGRYDVLVAQQRLGHLWKDIKAFDQTEPFKEKRTITVRELIDYLAAGEKMTNKIPVEVREWVIKEGEQPAEIREPITYSHYAANELRTYFPQGVQAFIAAVPTGSTQTQVTGPRSYLMSHNWDPDAKNIYISTKGTEQNWSTELRNVMDAVRFEVSIDNGRPCLRATGKSLDKLKKLPNTNFDTWEVVDWRVFKNVNSNGIGIHQDVIAFRNLEGVSAEATMSWLPYRP